MLEKLALRLLSDEVDKYNKDLLVEGVNLTSDIAHIKRLGFINESSSDTENNSVSELASRLASIKFDENQIIEDRQAAVYKAAITKSSLNEGSTNLDQLREEYAKLCKDPTATVEKKQSVLSKMKNIEKNKKEE